jgi:hypothetical protein
VPQHYRALFRCPFSPRTEAEQRNSGLFAYQLGHWFRLLKTLLKRAIPTGTGVALLEHSPVGLVDIVARKIEGGWIYG